MGQTIYFKTGEYDAEALAALMSAQFGSATALSVCDRETLIADALSDAHAMSYWRAVRSAISKVTVHGDQKSVMPIKASPVDGTKLLSIFTQITNSDSRQRLLDYAITLLRREALE